MATNQDSFPITAGMLAYAWVKPTVTFYTKAGAANATDTYLPALLTERAGARGGPNSAVSTDPNWAFAIAAEGPAVECDQTMSISNVETLLANEDTRGKAKK